MVKKPILIIIFLLTGLSGFFLLTAKSDFDFSNAPPARDYALNLWFDSSEKYFPTDPLDFYHENGKEISGEKAKEKYDRLSFEEKSNNFKVFYTVKDSDNAWVYEYWLLYVFNDYENAHYGDWETVYVAVDKKTGNVSRINGSSHGWGDNELKISNSKEKHFWVYVGNGSHANCPDKEGDGICNFLSWHIGKQSRDWTEEDIKNGRKVSFDSYTLEKINDEFIGKFQNQITLDKDLSPTLGINPSKFFNLEKLKIPLPKKLAYLKPPLLGEHVGQTPTFPWTREEYDNPEKMRPFSAIAAEKTQNFISKTAEAARDAVQTTIKNINPFSPAALMVQESAPLVATQEQKTEQETEIAEVAPQAAENLENLTESSFQIVQLTVDDIQEDLDDIAEKIDTISQKTKILAPEIISEPAIPKPEEKPEAAPEEPPQLADETKKETENNKAEKPKEETKEAATQPEILPKIAEKTIEVTMEGAATVGSKSAPSPLPPPPPPPPAEIFITEVQISGASAQDDFIEIYNPVTSSIDVSGFQLKKRSSTGKEYSVRLFPQNSVIAGLNYFLWLNSDYNSSSSIEAEVESSQNLAKNNSIALFDKYDRIIDSLAWGTGTDQFLENRSFPDNPESNFSLARKWSDKNNNYTNDFEIQAPTPGAKNQIAIPEPPAPEPSVPEPSLSVVINEIAWAGTKANSADEWLEFYNNSSAEINIAGWTLKAEDESPSTTFSSLLGTTTIPANGFYLLERSDDQSIYDISADYIFTGALSNDGEKLELRDDQNNLIDLVDFSSGWPAGSSTPNYISMERINSSASGTDAANWASNNLLSRNSQDFRGYFINGTPKAQNSVSKSSTEFSYYLPFSEFDELTLTYLGSPYVFKGSHNIFAGKGLKIEPGVTLKIDDNSYLFVEGKIEAIGVAENKIVFTANSQSPVPGSEGYIYYKNSMGNKLENVVVEYGGLVSYTKSAIFAEDSEISIKNSLFQNNYPGSLWLKNSTSTIENSEFLNTAPNWEFYIATALSIDGGTSIVKNSTFKKNGTAFKIQSGEVTVENNLFENNKTPIYLDGSPQTVFSQNIARNNELDAILTSVSTIDSNVVWQGNLPFIMKEGKSVGAGATLTLEAGTILKNGRAFNIHGKLITRGTAENPVIITSPPWTARSGRIIFENSGSILDNTIIEHGQGQCDQHGCWGAINQSDKNIEIEIKNSRIENNVWGITSKEDDCQTALEKIKIENTVFSGNVKDIYIPEKITSCPAP